ADGSFSAKIPAGRYSLKAIAKGFSEVLFSSVQVNPSAEIAYRFNLEPVGSGRTLVEQRSDRDNVKWTLRAAQSRRSIFQAKEGSDQTIAAVEEQEAAKDVAETNDTLRTDRSGHLLAQGVVETYFSDANRFSPSYEGLNFAIALPASERIDLIFAGQTGIGAAAPQRFETTAKWRANDRHRLGVSAGGARFLTFGTNGADGVARRTLGQMSVRAIDEW